MQRLVLVAFTFLSLIELNPFGPSLAEKYINRFNSIAISEMDRTGIPASIKLAQGLLESDWGRSDLATMGNNHFGIKCGGEWEGNRFYKEDDDYKDGKLIESCFRAYGHPEESYIAHSEFLSRPRASKRYDFLFDYPINDYQSWAKGLQKAGYATDPNYPNKLIAIIEKYNLHQFDSLSAQEETPVIAAADNKSTKEPELAIETSAETKQPENTEVWTDTGVDNEDVVVAYINDTPYIKSQKDDTPYSISQKFKVPLYRLHTYNEGLGKSKKTLSPGTVVFLDMKKENYSGTGEYFVKTGDSMHSIAQQFGIQLNSLYLRNRIPQGAEPLPGQKIKLDGMVKLGNRPKFKTATELEADQTEFLFDEDFVGTNE